MEAGSSLKKDWMLTPGAFAKLLARFDADLDRAGAEYEVVRERLVGLFRWRGLEFPEDCADETINRVARKLEEGEEIQNLSAYIGGVARLVQLEAFKERERRQSALDSVPQTLYYTSSDEHDESDFRQTCFERCLQTLSAETRLFMLEYYGDDEETTRIERRKRMASRLGVELNALRNRALRARAKLEECITKCVNGDESKCA